MGRKRRRERGPDTGSKGNSEKHKSRFSSLPSVATFLVLLRLSALASQVEAFLPSNQHNGIFISLSEDKLPEAKRSPCCMSARGIDGITTSRTWNQHPNLPPSSQHQAPSRPTRRRRQTKSKPIPVTGYNGKEIEDFYDRRPLQVGWRLNILGFPLLGTFFLFALASADRGVIAC